MIHQKGAMVDSLLSRALFSFEFRFDRSDINEGFLHIHSMSNRKRQFTNGIHINFLTYIPQLHKMQENKQRYPPDDHNRMPCPSH